MFEFLQAAQGHVSRCLGVSQNIWNSVLFLLTDFGSILARPFFQTTLFVTAIELPQISRQAKRICGNSNSPKSRGRLARLAYFSVAVFALMICSVAGAQTATTTSLSVTPMTAAYGSVVKITASVTAGATHPSAGTVTFSDTFNAATHVLGTVQVQSANGNAILQRELGGIGTHSVTATFNATKSYQSSSSTPQSVAITGQYPTTASLLQTGGTTGNWSLTATITGTGSLSLSPGGNVSLLDTTNGGYLLGTAGLGTGTIAQQTVWGAGSPIGIGNNPESVAVGDFNGDGKADLVVKGSVPNGISQNSDGFVALLSKGDGSFTVEPLVAISPTPTYSGVTYASNSGSVTVTDFNGDGKGDLAVLTDDVVQVLLSNGDGTFKVAASIDSGGETDPDWLALAFADFNGDGTPEIGRASGRERVLMSV